MEESKIAMKLEKEMEPIKKMCEPLEDAVKHELSKGIENINAAELGAVIDMIKDLYEAKEKMVKACYYKQIMEAMEESEYGEDYDEEGPMDNMRRGYRGQPRDSMGRFMSGRRRGRRGYEEPMYRMTPEMYREHDPEYWRDMDVAEGRMYYSGGGIGSSGSSGGSSVGSQSSGSMSGGSSGGNMGSSSGMGGSSRGYSEGGNYDGNRGGGRDSREGRSGEKRRGYMEAKEMGKDKQSKMKELEEYMKELGSDVSEMITDMSPEEKSLMKQKMQVLMQKIS